MGYTEAEMKALCLALAEQAEPLEAGALRDVARNYADHVERGDYELTFRHLIIVVLAIYGILTPIYLAAPRESSARPEAARIEQIFGFRKTEDGRYITRTYAFGPRQSFVSGVRQWSYAEEQKPVAYEGDRPLLDYELQELSPQNAWRFVTIRTSDGSDPNTNGRRYYLAVPK